MKESQIVQFCGAFVMLCTLVLIMLSAADICYIEALDAVLFMVKGFALYIIGMWMQTVGNRKK